MCNCGKSSAYVVTYPDGRTVTKNSETAARRTVALVPGATYAKK